MHSFIQKVWLKVPGNHSKKTNGAVEEDGIIMSYDDFQKSR